MKNSGSLEEVVTPADNEATKKLVYLILMFCFMVILIALLAAADSLFIAQLGFPKGVGGGIITIFVIITNIIGFDGIKKIMPLIVPVMLVIMLGIAIGIIVETEPGSSENPGQYTSPLAPNWFIGSILYLSYNFIASIPLICVLRKGKKEKKTAMAGMLLGFSATCIFGFLLYVAIMTDIDIAGTHDIPMIYLSSKISPVVAAIYSVVMIIAIYSASSNCLYGLTKEIDTGNKRKRIISIIAIGAVGYVISLVGFSQIVTYAYPIQGYACIVIMVCIVISFIKYRKKSSSKI